MKNAMILAAGRGERLRPLTDRQPKPLCQIKGKALIAYHVEALARAGVEHIVINHAWLGGQIRQYLGQGQAFGVQICYSPEPCGALETGGALLQALPLLGAGAFIAVNADIFTDYDFGRLQLPADRLGHLVLTATQASLGHRGDFGLDKQGSILTERADYTYTGIACYHPDLFQGLAFGRFSITPRLRQQAKAGRVSGEVYAGSWHDIGSIARLQAV